MSIDKLGANDIARTYLQGSESAQAAAAAQRRNEPTPEKAPQSDQVSLSQKGRDLAAARNAVAAAPDVREGKVADIKQRIEDGTYQVAPRALARKIIDHVTGQG